MKMKRFFALLLAMCLLLSLSACRQDDNSGTIGSVSNQLQKENNSAGDTAVTDSTDNQASFVTGTEVAFRDNDDLINPEKFAGKKIQIYGYSSKTYENLANMGEGSFIWMVRAAVADWAALNQVEVEFVGGFDQHVIKGDIDAGGKPDLLIYANKFPVTATSGITRAFTDEEYEALANTCGKEYLDMLTHKGKSYGVVSPWADGEAFFYNKTLFEQHGVKSPADYYKEGNWNWDTMEKCLTEITKDTDGDGKMDIYGTGTLFRLVHPYEYSYDPVTGKLTSTVLTRPEVRRYFEINYKGKQETKAVGDYTDCNFVAASRPATHIGDVQWYDFAHVYQKLSNGDIINAIPIPRYTDDSESYYRYNTVYSSILSSCDEPEATLSLLNYTLRVGMRYMSDYSLGLYKCNYEGIRGACAYSQGWKENLTKIVADRQAKFDALEAWDQELYKKFQYDILHADHPWTGYTFPVATSIYLPDTPKPPETALQILAERNQLWIDEYNNLYTE